MDRAFLSLCRVDDAGDGEEELGVSIGRPNYMATWFCQEKLDHRHFRHI
jgi:hypothetical protein